MGLWSIFGPKAAMRYAERGPYAKAQGGIYYTRLAEFLQYPDIIVPAGTTPEERAAYLELFQTFVKFKTVKRSLLAKVEANLYPGRPHRRT